MTTLRTPGRDPLLDGTEKELDSFLFGSKKGVATLLGWVSYHVLHSQGSSPGYPDRTCWRERVIWAELKSETNTPSVRQIAVMTGLAKAGGEVYLVKPQDADEFAKVLGSRSTFAGGALTSATLGTWIPNSLWTVHGCRYDDWLASL